MTTNRLARAGEGHVSKLTAADYASIALHNARTYAELDERTLRLVPVFFGVLLIGLLWLMADGLTRSCSASTSVVID